MKTGTYLNLITIMRNILAEHGPNAILNIRADDGCWTIRDVVTRKCLADGDTLVEISSYMNERAEQESST